MQPVGLYYSNKPKRSSPSPVRVFTTSRPGIEAPVITMTGADGATITMDRTDAVVTYLALGVALKANKEG